MEGYIVQRIMKAMGVDPVSLDPNIQRAPITGITTDSRKVNPGEVFFAIRGERFDGAEYVKDAAGAGAILSVVNAGRNAGPYASPVAVVENTVDALGKAAADYRSTFAGKVVAITGTSGKTTVKEMLLAILGRKFRVHGTAGNFNNRIGLPLTMFGLRESHDCAVFELGMSAPGEISELAAMCKPDIGVILNIGQGHAAFFDGIESIAEAKMELLPALTSRGTAIINGDDALLYPAPERTAARIVRFGLGDNADYRAEAVEIGTDGCARFTVEGNRVALRVPGSHAVLNALAAYTAAREMGMDMDGATAADALSAFEAPKLRMQRIVRDGVTCLNDTYNANPVSMRAAADVVKQTAARRKIAVLGDMLELGEFSERAHRETGELFARSGIGLLCLVGEFAGSYAEGAVEGGLARDRVRVFASTAEAAEFLTAEKHPGDLILVKGSRGMRMERIIDSLCGGA